jgi:hypothetical protein
VCVCARARARMRAVRVSMCAFLRIDVQFCASEGGSGGPRQPHIGLEIKELWQASHKCPAKYLAGLCV